MKKFLSILTVVLGTTLSACAGDVVTRDINKLPENARKSLNANFPQAKISYIKIDKELLRKDTFEAILTDGTKVEFDGEGNWKEVDCGRNAVPEAYIPTQIRTYLKANFPQQKVTTIERERRKYKVELDNELDAEFDLQGNFLRLDD